MKIEAGNGYVGASQRTQTATSALAGYSSAPAATQPEASASKSSGIDQADFTRMTRQDLFDWMNSRIKSGEMSLEDGSAFLGMTLKMPVGGNASALDDREQVDFMQLARDGASWARQHNDQAQLLSLQKAMAIMQQHQGEPIRVSVLA